MRLEPVDGLEGLRHAPVALKRKGLGDDADGQRPIRLGQLGHHRRRARAGAATHACDDEDHVGAADHLANLFEALLRRRLALIRAAARAKAARGAGANAQPVRRKRGVNGLDVGVDRPELDRLLRRLAKLDHAVHRVAAAAADADDL